MSYEKLGFTSGQTLKAEHLNHMEEGIANAGGVSSWNDLTDKPFGEEITTIFPETELIFTDMGGMIGTQLAFPVELIAGNIYTVVYNGESFECRAASEDSTEEMYLGNYGMITGDGDTGEPFIIGVFGGNLVIISLAGLSSATISIHGEAIKTIPPEYAPQPEYIYLNNLDPDFYVRTNKVATLVLTDDAKQDFEKRLSKARKMGTVRVVCKFDLSFDSSYLGSSNINGTMTCTMEINSYCMSCVVNDNLITIQYEDGTLTAIARQIAFRT